MMILIDSTHDDNNFFHKFFILFMIDRLFDRLLFYLTSNANILTLHLRHGLI